MDSNFKKPPAAVMPKVVCMLTGMPVNISEGDDVTITVFQGGKLIGLVSPEALQDAKTVRLAFTRNTPHGALVPLQAQVIEQFRLSAADDDA